MIKKGYEDLKIYKKAYELAMKIHKMTLKLPKFELYEEGVQIRKSSKSIVANIVEGYGRKKYKKEFFRFLTYAYASCNETKVHIKFLFDSEHITKEQFEQYLEDYNDLSRRIHNYRKSFEKKYPAQH